MKRSLVVSAVALAVLAASCEDCDDDKSRFKALPVAFMFRVIGRGTVRAYARGEDGPIETTCGYVALVGEPQTMDPVTDCPLPGVAQPGTTVQLFADDTYPGWTFASWGTRCGSTNGRAADVSATGSTEAAPCIVTFTGSDDEPFDADVADAEPPDGEAADASDGDAADASTDDGGDGGDGGDAGDEEDAGNAGPACDAGTVSDDAGGCCLPPQAACGGSAACCGSAASVASCDQGKCCIRRNHAGCETDRDCCTSPASGTSGTCQGGVCKCSPPQGRCEIAQQCCNEFAVGSPQDFMACSPASHTCCIASGANGWVSPTGTFTPCAADADCCSGKCNAGTCN
jgi:hypothetical protein